MRDEANHALGMMQSEYVQVVKPETHEYVGPMFRVLGLSVWHLAGAYPGSAESSESFTLNPEARNTWIYPHVEVRPVYHKYSRDS